MNITEVRVKLHTSDDGKLKGFASMTIENSFVVHDIRIREGEAGLYIVMPSRRAPDGRFKDICHPLNNDARKTIEHEVLGAYQRELGNF